MAVLVGNILLQYKRAVKCQNLFDSVVVSQRMSATCQASDIKMGTVIWREGFGHKSPSYVKIKFIP